MITAPWFRSNLSQGIEGKVYQHATAKRGKVSYDTP